MAQPGKRREKDASHPKDNRKGDQPVRIPPGLLMQLTQQPFPARAMVYLIFRPHHHDFPVRLVRKCLGHVPARIATRQKTVADNLERNQNKENNCHHPTNQGDIPVASTCPLRQEIASCRRCFLWIVHAMAFFLSRKIYPQASPTRSNWVPAAYPINSGYTCSPPTSAPLPRRRISTDLCS